MARNQAAFDLLLKNLSRDDPDTKTVQLDEQDLTEEDINNLCAAMAKSTHLRKLILVDIEFSSANVKALADFFAQNKTLIYVELSQTDLTPDQFAQLAPTLAGIPTLRQLVLSHNTLGENGLEALVTAFTAHPTLEYFNLAGCEIRDAGTAVVARLFAQPTTLNIVDLSFNGITEAGEANFSKVAAPQYILLQGNGRHAPKTNWQITTQIGSAFLGWLCCRDTSQVEVPKPAPTTTVPGSANSALKAS